MTQVVSSISGLEIYSPSAGFAPTNSGDVSAIASAYQVVSSTGTQLYAGTAYVTSVNGDPISASRAGNAANASMATSAYYDGTGRLISALPDAAEVSSIASSYADSAVSSKADSSSLSSYALSSDVSGVIDTVSANSASWSGGTLPITGSAGNDSATYGAGYVEYTRYDTAGEPDIRTASLSPDQFYIDYTLDENDHTIMTLTESMLDFTDSEGDHVVDAYSIDTWNSAVDTVANNSASWGGGATGDYVEKSATEVAIGSANTARNTAFAQGTANRASSYSFAQGYNNSASSISFAQGIGNTASGLSFAQGGGNSAINTAAVFGEYNLSGDGDTTSGNSAAFAIGDGTAWNARHDLMLVTKDGEITMYSSTADTVGTGIMSSLRAISAAATGGASLPISGSTGTDSATYDVNGIVYEHEPIDEFDSHMDASISVDRFGISRVTTDGDFYSVLLTDTGLSFTDQDGVHTVEASSIDSWNSAVDTVSSNSASWGQGGVDSATVSAIASSYAESAVSSKLDSSASSSFYTTANESGYVGSAYVDSAVSGKMDSSAMTSYALSSDVSGTVDLVSTQSANWGGSALALSAGPGVKLEMSGNTLVASTDETVLWTGSAATGSFALSESKKSFQKLAFYLVDVSGYNMVSTIEASASYASFDSLTPYPDVSNATISKFLTISASNTTSLTSVMHGRIIQSASHTEVSTNNGNCLYCTKIVGINRTAGV